MIGAILGDIVGSPFEFDMGNKTKDFQMFSKRSCFTDDTVMTVAVADALMEAGRDADLDRIRECCKRSMKKWAKRYPDAGYGGMFYRWVLMGGTEPYNSYGNGSAMRVSPVGWLYDDLDRTLEVAEATADITHNHPEGIKGARATAAVIWMGRNGYEKDEIKEYVIREFGYDLSRTCDEIRPYYKHIEACQYTVPEAITAFMEGTDFEDVVRTAVSLGGDCDTLTDIAAAMAEAFYGEVPEYMRVPVMARIPEDMKEVVERFEDYISEDVIY